MGSMKPMLADTGPLSDEIRRGRNIQEHWQAEPVPRRLACVRACRHALVSEADALCAAVASDIGKPADEALAAELLPLADACRYLERRAGRILQTRKVSSRDRPLWLWGQGDVVFRRPRGLVGIIGTWNYPLMLNGVQILQAVTAGNAVLWKPSEVAPASAAILTSLLDRAGFPPGLIQTLPATREAGHDLAQSAIDHVVFTGTSSTGRKLAETLGRRLVSSTMELSGCDAFLVLGDANIELAARAAWFGATLNGGQTCIAARRVFVQRSVLDPFVAALRHLAERAAPRPLALASQVDQAHRLVEDACRRGARVLDTAALPCGRSDPRLFPPTIILDARPEMAFCQEASFAPILAIIPFSSIEEALALDRQCPYGLAGAVFTQDRRSAEQIAARLRTGAVAVNDVIAPTAHPATPFGGRGESGWGVTQGAEGLLELTVPQVLSFKSGTFRPHYDSAAGKPLLSAQAFQGLLQWLHGRSVRERWQGFWQMIRNRRPPAPTPPVAAHSAAEGSETEAVAHTD